MALRLGTGGLKYPLPVAPDAQQSIAAASAGGSAAASAYGANRSFAANKMRVQADLANSAAERQQRAEQAYYDRGFRAQQNFYDREHQAGAQLQMQDFRANQEELDRNFRAYQQQSGQNFQLNRDKAEMDFTRERDQAQFDRSQTDERVTDESIRTGISSGDLVLSPGAQAAWDKLQTARAQAATQKDLTPEGRAEAERKIAEQERGILRTARPPLVSATDAANNNQTFYDPQSGRYEKEMAPGRVPGTLGKGGQFQPTMQQPDTSKEDAKRLAEEEKRARDILNQAKENGEKITPEQAMSQARTQMVEEQAGFDRARNPLPHPPMLPPGSQGQPAQVPAPPAPGNPGYQQPGPQGVKTHGGVRPADGTFNPQPGSGWVRQGDYWVNSGSIDLSGDGRFQKQGNSWVNVEAQQQQPQAPLPGKPPASGIASGSGNLGVGAAPPAQVITAPTQPGGAGPYNTWAGPPQASTTPAGFDQQWLQLPPGGTITGPDGKVYVKKKPQ